MAELRLHQVVKRFGHAEVIHGIDLEVEHGEFVVFVGPSGCGKSTLLRMIAGLEEVTDGEILIDGELVNEVDAAKRGLAMVFQSYALYPHMTVRKNLSFGLETMGAPKAVIAGAGRRGRAHPEDRAACSTAARPSSRAASGSGSRSAARSSASPRSSCSTSRSRTSMPSSASRCGSRSRSSTSGSARR